MIFNSLDFAVFLPVVFLLYWLVRERGLQNVVLLGASYVFYGWWDYRFLGLILVSTLIDYFVGKGIGRSDDPGRRKELLWLSISANLGMLGFFKYWNFFIDNFKEGFTFFGGQLDFGHLDIVLPVGISFYTFQTMSYTIDVYRGRLKPTRDFISFATFIAFFPQLVAGPIERATNLLPQFAVKRRFDYGQSVEGLRQILWGLFKKMVIADNAAIYVNLIFDSPESYGASTLVLGAVLFAFQIYGDFSGYSDIAIGTAKLFGIKLMQNFAYPYFSRDIAEFWRRWHISLSTWFRDYVYIPLGGSWTSRVKTMRNILIIFLVSGFWHGANWTFVFWGLLHALFFLPLFIFNQNRNNLIPIKTKYLMPSFRDSVAIVQTFVLTTVAWIFFRADSLGDALVYLKSMWAVTLFTLPDVHLVSRAYLTLGFIGVMLVVEWAGRTYSFPLARMEYFQNRWTRWSVYVLLIAAIGLFMPTAEVPFIYFQF